ncbi:MAG: MMPL family transporter [Verrucomicrobia bacterium]|nr:MMPL family transporter [Verrucomicrobiota bacterium]MBT7065775.1 MMPL family transporter [Verrucomicrobiota bacterium]MBT7700677.1 MMPL family transporter [Verrucomicrobiota bacterium]
MLWILGHRRTAFVAVALLALAFVFGIPRLKVDSSFSGLLIKNDPATDYYDAITETFGGDVMLSIVMASENVFTPRILQSVLDVTTEAEGMDGVIRVVSLATVSCLSGGEGFLQTDRVLPYAPTDDAELEDVRRRASDNPLLKGEVINTAGTATAIHLFLDADQDDMQFDTRLTDAVAALIAREQARLGPAVRIYQCGLPFLRVHASAQVKRDMVLLGPVSLGILFLVLFCFFRTPSAILVPCITGSISVAATLGLMGYAGMALNPLTSVIPSLLLVVGSTEDIHLLAEYAAGVRDGLTREEAIRRMALRSGLAILLTSLTTLIGFGTLMGSRIPMVAEFGMAASFGMAMNFIVTILLAPHCIAWFKAGHASRERPAGGVQHFFLQSVLHHRRLILAGALGVVALALWGGSRIVADTDYLRFFRHNSVVRQAYRDMRADLVGATSFLVVVESGEPEGIKQPEVLRQIDGLGRHLAARHDKVMGFADLVRHAHREMHAGDPAFDAIPSTSDLVAQYILMLDRDDLERFVDFDFAQTCILVRSGVQGSRQLSAVKRDVQRYVAAHFGPDLTCHVTGDSILMARASDVVSREALVSLLCVLGAIFVLIWILFASAKAGLLAMVPNVVPMLVNFGVMGWLGFPLSVATFPVAVIALGIAVDDTIHLMVRYANQLRTGQTNDESMISTVRCELRPVLSTSLALSLGFVVFVLARFGSTQQFGILGGIIMLVALVSDLFITPALLLATPLVTAWSLLRLKLDKGIAEKSPMFKGLSLREVKRVVVMGAVREAPAGTRILEEGETGRDLIVVLAGAAEIRSGESEQVLGAVQRGDVVGEMAFLSGHRRSASVVATAPVEYLEISAATLDKVRLRHPDVAAKVFYNMARLLSTRLAETTDSLVGR